MIEKCNLNISMILSCSHYRNKHVKHVLVTQSFYLYAASKNGAVILSRNGVTSTSYYYGTVRVYYNSGWGNICYDSSYDYNEANVICHQLGYTGASSYSRAGLVRLVYIFKLGLKYLCLAMGLMFYL